MSHPSPIFSIVIPALNEEICLPRLLSDLAKQSYRDFEVIIVDGSSTDSTVPRALRFQSKLPSLQIVTSKIRQVCVQRNLGAKNATGAYLLFMDADDRIPSYFLQGIKYQTEVHRPQIFTTYMESDSRNRSDKTIAAILSLYTDLTKNTPNMALTEAFIGFKREQFLSLGGFSQDTYWGEGSELYTRAHEQKIPVAVFKHPKYTFSFRRLKKQGRLKSISHSLQLEITRVLNIKLPKQIVSNLYPMDEGGQKYRTQTTRSNLLDRFLKDSPLTELGQILNQEPKIITKLKEYFKSLD